MTSLYKTTILPPANRITIKHLQIFSQPPLMAATKQTCNIAVVIVPFPAQGHLNQLLHLSRLLAGYNFPIHILSTTTHARQALTRLHGWNPRVVDNLHFHTHPTPPFPSPSPDPAAAVKFPSHLLPSFKSAMHLRQPFVDLLAVLSLSAKRVVVIHDYLISPVVQDVTSFPNAEAYLFSCCSAFTSLWYHWEATGRPVLDGELQTLRNQLPTREGCVSIDGLQFILSTDVSCKEFSSGTIIDACRVIEGKFIDLIEPEHKTLFALGPFNPVAIDSNVSTQKRHKLFDWLDKQEPNSVIYVSFGTTTSISNEQIEQLALGLEQSEVRFIWVLRDADKGDIFAGGDRKMELPEGFLERLGDGGVVTTEWVPQLEILGHPATGGFMSHCGWNSCMESLTMGVPVAAWPMHSDQPRNAMLLTTVLGIGIYVRDWSEREELVRSTVVGEVVRRLMVTEEGAEMRLRAAEVGGGVRRSVGDGGVTRKELDSFVAHVTR